MTSDRKIKVTLAFLILHMRATMRIMNMTRNTRKKPRTVKYLLFQLEMFSTFSFGLDFSVVLPPSWSSSRSKALPSLLISFSSGEGSANGFSPACVLTIAVSVNS